MTDSQKTINVIKRTLPTLVHRVQEGIYHIVGYIYENNDGSKGFLIEGSGFSELEAWKDAYDWVNKIGNYRTIDELQMF